VTAQAAKAGTDSNDAQQGASGRDETPAETLDRNWNELLQELRVVQTGVQILTGFLLTLPFQQRFASLSGAQHGMFLVAVALAAIATGLLVAPVSSHRLLFRQQEKDALVDAANVLAKAGIAVLALAIVSVVLLVWDVVLGRSWALAAAGTAASFYAFAWFGLPRLLDRLRGRDRA
jgi:hypothetical protein